jgi:hypothetical protein
LSYGGGGAACADVSETVYRFLTGGIHRPVRRAVTLAE